MEALYLILALSGVAVGDPTANFTSVVLPLMASPQKAYELPPQNEVTRSAIEEAEFLVSGRPLAIKDLQDELINTGHALQVRNFGECEGSSKGTACGSVVIGRRFFSVSTADLKKVAEIYTSDLRDPSDKSLTVHGVTIERHHWEFEKNQALKIAQSPGPMEVGGEYRIKKCRNGLMVSWKCNTIAYQLFQIDNSTLFLLGRQIQTNSEPDSYKIQNCEKKQCTDTFLEKQKRNSAAGTLSFTVFKAIPNDNGKSAIKIFETNFGSTKDASEVKLMGLVEGEMKEALGSEYNISGKKIRRFFPLDSIERLVSKPAFNRTKVYVLGFSLIVILCVFFSAHLFSEFYDARLSVEQKIKEVALPKISALETNADLHRLIDRLKSENASLKEKLKK